MRQQAGVALACEHQLVGRTCRNLSDRFCIPWGMQELMPPRAKAVLLDYARLDDEALVAVVRSGGRDVFRYVMASATNIFPPLMLHLVGSGEASGKLEHMLERAAQLETQTLERRLAVLLTLLEPVMILVMGGVVLIIVLAILLPIMEINQLVQ